MSESNQSPDSVIHELGMSESNQSPLAIDVLGTNAKPEISFYRLARMGFLPSFLPSCTAV
jgi:hypothetical protein